MSFERRPFGLYCSLSRVDNAQKDKDIETEVPWKNVYHTFFIYLFHLKLHEISPVAIQQSDGLKVTCLRS